jgi:hypothetical protein
MPALACLARVPPASRESAKTMHSKRLSSDVCAATEPRLLRDEDADSGDCDSKSETSERSSTSTSSTNIDLDETAEALQRLTALLARERLTPVRAHQQRLSSRTICPLSSATPCHAGLAVPQPLSWGASPPPLSYANACIFSENARERNAATRVTRPSWHSCTRTRHLEAKKNARFCTHNATPTNCVPDRHVVKAHSCTRRHPSAHTPSATRVSLFIIGSLLSPFPRLHVPLLTSLIASQHF